MARCAFLITPEDVLDPKANFEIQSLQAAEKYFWRKTSAKFLVDLRFYCLA